MVNFMGQLECAQRGPGSWSNMQLACLRGFFQKEIAVESGLSVGGTSACIEGMNRAKRQRKGKFSHSLLELGDHSFLCSDIRDPGSWDSGLNPPAALDLQLAGGRECDV